MTAPEKPIVKLTPQRALKEFLNNAFVLPFMDRGRAFIYFTSFFFALGSAFLDIFIAIDTAGMSVQALMEFLLTKFGLILVVLPMATYAIGRVRDGILYPVFLLITAIAPVLLFIKDGALSPGEAGALYALGVSPFWAIYHVMFATATSDKNLGHEVAMAGTGMTVGMTFGSLLGGLCSQFGFEYIGLFIGFSILIGSTGALVIKARRNAFSANLRASGAMDETMWTALKRCKYRSVGAFLEGIFQLISGNLWVVYLNLCGIAAASVGVWQAVMVLCRVVATPFAGALVNNGRRREMLLGSGLNLVGWSPFLYGATSLFVLPFMNVWSVGLQLFSTGLISAWYGSRTVAAIMVREIIMGIGRTGFILILTPLLYADKALFMNTVIVLASILTVYSALWMRSVKMRGRVLPMENIVTRV